MLARAMLVPLLDSLPVPPSKPEARLLQALEMADEGIAMKRLALRRQHPDETEEEIAARLRRWLHHEDSR
mgnify:CR=1 FL=1